METQEERALQNRVDYLTEQLGEERREHALEVALLEGQVIGLKQALELATTVGVTYE